MAFYPKRCEGINTHKFILVFSNLVECTWLFSSNRACELLEDKITSSIATCYTYDDPGKTKKDDL